jgi:hypothetical protein
MNLKIKVFFLKVGLDLFTIAYFFGSNILNSKDVIFKNKLKNIWCHLLLKS